MLFVSGDKDEIVPHHMTLQLYDNAKTSVYKDKVSCKYFLFFFLYHNHFTILVSDKEWHT
jgi:hypothetical protein